MNNISLLYSTGVEQVDNILCGVIGMYEMIFPNAIRGYYLLGSYKEGTSVPISDIDIDIIFKDAFDVEKANQAKQYCSLISSVRLDITPKTKEQILPEDIRLKLSSILLYGEDIREMLSLLSMKSYLRYITGWPLHFLTRIRRMQQLTFPLDYPDPNGEFYGYDTKSIPGWYPSWVERGTKELVADICWITTALLGLKAGRYAGNKAEAIRFYGKYIGDEWTPFTQDMYKKAKLEWMYGIPEGAREQKQLRELCRQTLDFENHFLTVYRDYLLTNLCSTSEDDQLFAVEQLMQVVYLDEEITNILQELQASRRVQSSP